MEYEDKSTLLILFEGIKDSILSKVPEISEVVIWSNQLTNEDIQRPFSYPYVAVEFVADWDKPEAMGSVYPNVGNIGYPKKGVATVTIHTLFRNRDDDTNTFIQNEPIRHKVHRAVDLLCNPDGFYTALLKRRDDVPIDFGSYQDYQTVYESSIKEGAVIIGEEGVITEIEVNSDRDTPLIIN